MQEQLPGTTTYALRRSARRRRTIELSVDPAGGLIVAAPMRTPHHEIDAFVQQKTRWIRKALRDARERAKHLRRDFVTGESLPYLGRSLRLSVVDAVAGRSGVELRGACLELRLPPGVSEGERRSAIIKSLEGWYQTPARTALLDRVQFFAPLLGVEPKAVRVRNQKTRWGSCGKDATLYFSWRLIMAPPAVADYLVVHELCHLRRPDHGRAFWSLVASVLPDSQERRAELRRDGWRYRLC